MSGIVRSNNIDDMKTNSMSQRDTILGFREFLQNELANRCSENTSYSLRAFARSLSIDHSSLSQILRGKRKLTKSSIHRLGEEIGLEQDRTDHFLATKERVSQYRTHRRNEKQIRCRWILLRWVLPLIRKNFLSPIRATERRSKSLRIVLPVCRNLRLIMAILSCIYYKSYRKILYRTRFIPNDGVAIFLESFALLGNVV